MTRIIWAQELFQGLRKVTSVIERLAVETDDSALQTRESLQMVAQSMRRAARDVWTPDDGLFAIRCASQTR